MIKGSSPIGELSFDPSTGILHIVVNQDAEMTLTNAREHYNIIKKVVGNKKYVALVDAGNFYSIDAEAWKYASQKEIVGNRIATANYNVALPNKLVSKFFKEKYNTAAPFKIFSTYEEALVWLKTFDMNS